MNHEKRDYRVGMFILFGIIFLGILIVLYGEEPTWLWATKWDLQVYVDRPQGVEEGTPAYLQGVQIGRVRTIQLRDSSVPGLGAAVIIEVDEQFDIPKFSRAELHAKFGFDKGAIHIQPPAERQPALPKDGSGSIHGEMLGPLASVVPEEFVESLVLAVEEIAKVGAVADDLHELLQKRSLELVDDPTTDAMANVHTLIQRVDESFRLLNAFFEDGGTADLQTVITNFKSSSESLKNWSQNLDSGTQQIVDRADSTMKSLEQQSINVATAAVDALERMSQLLDELHRTSTAINESKGALGMIVNDPQFYEELIFSMDKLQALLDEWTRTALSIQEEGVKLRALP